MKHILFILFAFVFSVTSKAQFSSASITAAGLTCAMCTKAIHTSLQKLSIVKSVDADIKNSAFIVEFKSGVQADPDLLKAAVEDAGFSIASLQMTADFDHLRVANDTHVNLDGMTFHFLRVANGDLHGKRTVTIVDKNFLTAKEFKKYATSTSMECVQTGKADQCCTKGGPASGRRIYHVTI